MNDLRTLLAHPPDGVQVDVDAVTARLVLAEFGLRVNHPLWLVVRVATLLLVLASVPTTLGYSGVPIGLAVLASVAYTMLYRFSPRVTRRRDLTIGPRGLQFGGRTVPLSEELDLRTVPVKTVNGLRHRLDVTSQGTRRSFWLESVEQTEVVAWMSGVLAMLVDRHRVDPQEEPPDELVGLARRSAELQQAER